MATKPNKTNRYKKIEGFNNEPFTVDGLGFEPVKSMRITPITDTTSLYSTGNIESNNGITSHEIRGDYSPAVGSTPNYGPNTYHRNMFDEDPHYIPPPPSYTPLSEKEKKDLLDNMSLKRKRTGGKTKKKTNKSKRKKKKTNKSKRKKTKSKRARTIAKNK